MMFRVFPATLTPTGEKVPLLNGWQEIATKDEKQVKSWQQQFGTHLTFLGVPCGPTNDILVLDVDTKTHNGFVTLKEKGLVIPHTLSQRTLSGGIHYFFKYPKTGKEYPNRVGFLPGLDIRSKGGWIAWYGKDVQWNPIADAPTWLLEAIERKSLAPQGSTFIVSPEVAQPIIDAAIEAIREAPPGESNDILNLQSFKVGQLVASNALTREEAEKLLYEAALYRGKPPYEAKATIRSGLDGGIKKPLTTQFTEPIPQIYIPPPPPMPESWTPKKFTKYDLLNMSKLRKPQLFKDWSTEDIHITTADGGTGKTTLKLFEAICLALGDRFLGFECKQPGKTLFITGEDTAEKLGAMIGAIARQMGILEDSTKLNTVLESIVVKKDSDLCIITKDKQGFLHPNTQAYDKVIEAVKEFNPKMIVFDPISTFWGSEAALNDMAKAVSRFMSRLTEESGACVEMINHMGKASSNAKDMSQFAGRGGTGLPSHARVSRVMRLVLEDEYKELTGEDLGENKSAILVNVNKFTDGSPLFNEPFLIIREGYLFHRKTLEKAKIREERDKASDTEMVYKFVRDVRIAGKWPTKQLVIAKFMQNGELSKDRVSRALDLLQFEGLGGNYLRQTQNPDPSDKQSVYVITDVDGKECMSL